MKEILDDTFANSNTSSSLEHKNSKRILNFGEEAIPWLIESIDFYGWSSILFLHEITKENPIQKENVGKFYEICEDWRFWYVSKLRDDKINKILY